MARLSSAIGLVESGDLAAAQMQLRELQQGTMLGHSALLFCLLHDAAAPVADVVANTVVSVCVPSASGQRACGACQCARP